MLRPSRLTVALALAACDRSAPGNAGTPPAQSEAAGAGPKATLVLRGGNGVAVDPAIGQAQAIAGDGYEMTAGGGGREIGAVAAAREAGGLPERGERAQAAAQRGVVVLDRDRGGDLAPGNLLITDGGARAFDGLDVEAGDTAVAATFARYAGLR